MDLITFVDIPFALVSFVWLKWKVGIDLKSINRIQILFEILFRPSVDFIGPSMVVERHRRDTRSRKHHKHRNHRCHFQGQVRDDHTSSVALSACNGIVSIHKIQHYHCYFQLILNKKKWKIRELNIKLNLSQNFYLQLVIVGCQSNFKTNKLIKFTMSPFALYLKLFWFNVTNLPPNCAAQSHKSAPIFRLQSFDHWVFILDVWWHFHAIYSLNSYC